MPSPRFRLSHWLSLSLLLGLYLGHLIPGFFIDPPPWPDEAIIADTGLNLLAISLKAPVSGLGWSLEPLKLAAGTPGSIFSWLGLGLACCPLASFTFGSCPLSPAVSTYSWLPIFPGVWLLGFGGWPLWFSSAITNLFGPAVSVDRKSSASCSSWRLWLCSSNWFEIRLIPLFRVSLWLPYKL
ncbi:hypothetical protein A2W24_02315 [Microgenomates group bacterium RBG_16_45_19]|nr:MAG: hypothetical protein A2W24_02315 [Microgenomates group bacterium RBG_16_45_19]